MAPVTCIRSNKTRTIEIKQMLNMSSLLFLLMYIPSFYQIWANILCSFFVGEYADAYAYFNDQINLESFINKNKA